MQHIFYLIIRLPSGSSCATPSPSTTSTGPYSRGLGHLAEPPQSSIASLLGNAPSQKDLPSSASTTAYSISSRQYSLESENLIAFIDDI